MDHSTTHSKDNELIAIRETVGELNLKGCALSIDAIGCQKEDSATVKHDAFSTLEKARFRVKERIS